MSRTVFPALRYAAGPTARHTLRERGLTPDALTAIVGPASGPKWIVLAAVDRALIDCGFLSIRRPELGDDDHAPGDRLLLAGSSAGAWRMLAFAARDPRRAHRVLFERYVGMQFPSGGTPSPAEVSAAYRDMLDEIFPHDERAHLIDGCGFDLAIHTARVKRAAPGWSLAPRAVQALTLAVTGAVQLLHRSGSAVTFERVLFHTRPQRFSPAFDGTLVRLDEGNLIQAALAAGTVPLYMKPQSELPDAPAGRYLDGGLTDYHLNQRYAPPGDDGIVLFPHYQRRIVPTWFDRYRDRRAPAAEALDNVLQLYPSDELIAALPDGRVPDRDDFFRFGDDTAARVAQWTRAADIAERLAEQFVDDLDTGRIPDLVEPL